MDDRAFCEVLRIERTVCATWIERQWLSPLRQEGVGPDFREVDIARGRLLLDLERTMGVNSEGIDLIVHLVDQFYGLRLTLGDLVAAINAQPPEVRRRILAEAEAAREPDAAPEVLVGQPRRGS